MTKMTISLKGNCGNCMDYEHLTNEEIIEEAEELEDNKSFSEAIICWRTLFTRNPDPFYLVRIGCLAMEMKNVIEAEQAFLSAINLCPKLYLAYQWLGVLYEEQGYLEKAEEYLEKCLSVKQNADIFTSLGSIQNQLGRIADARISFSKALQINPNYEEAMYNLAISLADEEPDKANSLFRKAIEIDPQYACAHRELGFLLKKWEEYSDAEYHIRKAIELDELNGRAYIYLGNLLWSKNELDEAEKSYKHAIQIWPNDSLTHWCLAHFYECHNRSEEAKGLYEKALQLDPDDLESNLRYGLFLINTDERDKAKTLLKHAHDLDPEDERVNKALDKLTND